MVTRYLIVGSGIAGLSASETLRRHDPAGDITLLSDEAHRFYSRPGLAYFLSQAIPDHQLFARTEAEIRALRVNRVQATAVELDPAEHVLKLADGRRLAYDRLLLATGSAALPPDFPAEMDGVVKLDNLDDARRIVKLAGRGRTAVVVGGGVTALELAEGLHGRGLDTHYFLRGDRYWGNVLDETESNIVEERLKAEGMRLHYRTRVKQALGRGGRLAGVETADGQKLACDVLAVAIGVRPRVELARTAGLRVDRGILVDEYLQTSAPDVFAAGDAAQAYDPRSGQTALDVLWSTALAQGQAAGANMAGARTPYIRRVARNVTHLAGLVTTIMGAVGGGRDDDLVTIARGDSETWRLRPQSWAFTDRKDVNRIRLLVGERAIVGGVVMGDQTLARPVYELIEAQADVAPILASLRSNPAAMPATVLDFYNRWRHVA